MIGFHSHCFLSFSRKCWKQLTPPYEPVSLQDRNPLWGKCFRVKTAERNPHRHTTTHIVYSENLKSLRTVEFCKGRPNGGFWTAAQTSPRWGGGCWGVLQQRGQFFPGRGSTVERPGAEAAPCSSAPCTIFRVSVSFPLPSCSRNVALAARFFI